MFSQISNQVVAGASIAITGMRFGTVLIVYQKQEFKAGYRSYGATNLRATGFSALVDCLCIAGMCVLVKDAVHFIVRLTFFFFFRQPTFSVPDNTFG